MCVHCPRFVSGLFDFCSNKVLYIYPGPLTLASFFCVLNNYIANDYEEQLVTGGVCCIESRNYVC